MPGKKLLRGNRLELPISVIVTPSEADRLWFDIKGIPQIRSNNPAEVIVQEDGDDLKDKRNKGAALASQPYLLFMEEGIYLYEFALKDLLTALVAGSKLAYTYCDARFVSPPQTTIPAVRGAWDPKVAYGGQEAGSVALVRVEALGAEPARRWDAWANLLQSEGVQRAYIKSVLFEKHLK